MSMAADEIKLCGQQAVMNKQTQERFLLSWEAVGGRSTAYTWML